MKPPAETAPRTMQILHPDLTMEWLRAHATGKQVSVAVVDSGVDATHPAVAGRLEHACVVGRGPDGAVVCRESSAGESVDSYGHGTGVAGVIASLAPDVRITSVKVLNDYNQCTGEEFIAGLRWAVERRVKLINLSLATAKPAYHSELFELCEQAHVQGLIIVAARRNFGEIGLPAKFSNVIGVDREDFLDRYRIRYYPSQAVTYGAHGTNVRVPGLNGGYALQTGTSFATPHVTGILALLLEPFPDLLCCEAKTILKAFAVL